MAEAIGIAITIMATFVGIAASIVGIFWGITLKKSVGLMYGIEPKGEA